MEDLFGYLALAFFESDNKIKTIYKNGTKFFR